MVIESRISKAFRPTDFDQRRKTHEFEEPHTHVFPLLSGQRSTREQQLIVLERLTLDFMLPRFELQNAARASSQAVYNGS
jgi:hypothetical protein